MAGVLAPLLRYALDIRIYDYPNISKAYSVAGDIITAQVRTPIWQFEISMTTPILLWSQYRALVEDIRTLNTRQTFNLIIGDVDSPNLAVINAYLGTLTLTQLNAITVAPQQAGDQTNILRLANVPISTGFLFRKGDYIQPNQTALPLPARANKVYTVSNDVPLAGISTVAVALNRPIFTYPSVGTRLLVGNNVAWPVKIKDLPTPGLGNQFIGGITWSGNFNLEEVIS